MDDVLPEVELNVRVDILGDLGLNLRGNLLVSREACGEGDRHSQFVHAYLPADVSEVVANSGSSHNLVEDCDGLYALDVSHV